MKNTFLFIIIISLSSIRVVSQNINQTYPTLDNLLELRWKDKTKEYSSNPSAFHGIVYGSNEFEHAWLAETGEKLYFTNQKHQSIIRALSPDSILLFSFREGVRVVNIYNGDILYESFNKIKKPWIKKPRIIKTGTIFTAKNDSLFIAFSLIERKVIWQKKLNQVFDSPIIKSNTIYINDIDYLYALNIETGEEFWKEKIGELSSEPYLIENIYYAWLKNVGLIAYDIEKRFLKWVFKPNEFRGNFYELYFEDSLIFTSSLSLFAISIINGEVLWKNENVESRYSYILGATKQNILSYKNIDNYAVLVASDKKTGVIKYESFQGFDLIERPLSYLDNVTIRFANWTDENLVFGIDTNNNIYCFEVKEFND